MTALTTARLHAYLKGGRLFLAEHEGVLYATDSYVLWRVEAKSLLARLLDDYNLPLEPMSCHVGRTIKRYDGTTPAVGSLIPKPVEGPPLTRYRMGTNDVLVDAGGITCEVWRRPDHLLVGADQRKRSVVDGMFGVGEWWQPEKRLAPLQRHDDRGLVALLMPMRLHRSDDDLLADDTLEVAA